MTSESNQCVICLNDTYSQTSCICQNYQCNVCITRYFMEFGSHNCAYCRRPRRMSTDSVIFVCENIIHPNDEPNDYVSINHPIPDIRINSTVLFHSTENTEFENQAEDDNLITTDNEIENYPLDSSIYDINYHSDNVDSNSQTEERFN